jgi:hypothetical protein
MRLKLKSTLPPQLQLQKNDVLKMHKLLKKTGVELPDEEWTVFRELEKRYGLLTKEEQHQDMLRELRKKLIENSGSMTKQDAIRLIHLREKYDVQLDDLETANLNEVRIRHGIKTQREKEAKELKDLLMKSKKNPDELKLQELNRIKQLR